MPQFAPRSSLGSFFTIVSSGLLLAVVFLGPSGPVRAAGFDGSYTGTIERVRGDSPPCAKSGAQRSSITVANNKLDYIHFNAMDFSTQVAPDGSFIATTTNVIHSRRTPWTLKGKISGNTIDATMDNLYCGYHIMLKRS